MTLPLKEQLSIVVPVLNEELHLPRLLANIAPLGVNVFVVDSGSTDKTIEIAETAGCAVATGTWGSFSEKLNWAIQNTPYKTPWVMRMDADEWLSETLITSLRNFDFVNSSHVGYQINRRFYFMGRWIKHGGMYPFPVIRIFKRGVGFYEKRLTDEHLKLDGTVAHIHGDFADETLQPLANWFRKSVTYAETECYVTWNDLHQNTGSWKLVRGQAKLRRFLKEFVYNRTPVLLRSFLYWFYRCFILLGFLDGFPGIALHTFHALWYRMMIDAMVYEAKRTNGRTVKQDHLC